ncbi:NrfD/PsrC family molybdoenzyme membrane anchor subunit [Denitratisoma oestradiolicum]|uniref:Polysulfide reductase n=1 Tax=Denitratisoma oestradiolicum TaxID=311182 RepID=A0A6S6Y012_9PROT|nr:NrfD/PsrC family molybdoenzyme membrane anchor subunit [Denitratisoma oestradiolicum]TWO81328.1 polysulfide reductase [Denitratisoma oestradiolicum]CAB1368519.1 Polysulfide reductase [Denitratisoma oestradiolicum]
MQSSSDPKTLAEVFGFLGDLHRKEGTTTFIKLCLSLGREPSVATKWWQASLLVTAVCLLFVLYQLIFVGHAAFNTSSDGINWGMAVSTYVFFALTSSGLTMVASLATVFGFKQFYPVAKRCIYLAIITLISGFTVLALELGHPFRMLWSIPTGMQIMSPMFWMGVFYLIDLVLLIIKLYLLWQEEWDSPRSNAVGVAGFIAVILASGMLGLVFGSLSMRPMWYGSFTSIYFIITAALSGAAAIVVTTYMAYDFNRSNMPEPLRGLASGPQLPRVFAAFIGITLVMFVTRFWVGLWSNLDGLDGFQALVRTPLFHLELWLGLCLPFYLMASPSTQTNTQKQLIAAFLVLGAMFINRYEFVIGGQLVPMFKGTWVNDLIPYTPSLTEWALTLLGLSLCLALYALGEKVLKLSAMPSVVEMEKPGVAQA